MADLAKSVTGSLTRVLGFRLRRIVVRTLGGEVSDLVQLGAPLLNVGGEVRFDFEDESVFVSWVQNDGWPDYSSVGVRHESLFAREATLVDWDVSDLEPWRRCIGQRLIGARVFAMHDTPQVVELSFAGQSFWIACGYEKTVGDGDDLLIRTGAFPGLEGARLVWSA